MCPAHHPRLKKAPHRHLSFSLAIAATFSQCPHLFRLRFAIAIHSFEKYGGICHPAGVICDWWEMKTDKDAGKKEKGAMKERIKGKKGGGAAFRKPVSSRPTFIIRSRKGKGAYRRQRLGKRRGVSWERSEWLAADG